MFQELFGADDTAFGRDEDSEHRELLARQCDVAPVAVDLAPERIQSHTGDLAHRRPVVCAPAVECSDSQHEFSELERLREIVVGTELESGGFVVEPVGRSEHENRHTAAGGDDAFRDLVAAGPGDVSVEDRDVVGVHAQQFQRGVAVTRDVGRDCFQAQAIADGFGQIRLVFNDQYTRIPMLTSWCISPAYRKPQTRRQHLAVLTGAVSYRETPHLGITVYGCEQDEADLFHELGPRFGIAATTTSEAASEAAVVAVPWNRCISVGHKAEISRTMLHALHERGVEYISTRSIGVDHIDLDAAESLGISVGNVAYAPDGVADYTLMLILMAIRHVKRVARSAERHDFRLGGVRGKDLRDMTVGVLGVGSIGQAVITRLHGFGCRVLAYNNDRAAAAAADFVSLEELLRESDVVTLHMPLNADTHHVIGREQVDAMKPGACLVNTGRGALVDTDALISALESGKLGGVALDVLEGEEGIFYFDRTNAPVDNPFLLRLQQLPNAIVTPHTAYYTEGALYDTVEQTLMNCVSFERGRASAETQDRNPVRWVLGRA